MVQEIRISRDILTRFDKPFVLPEEVRLCMPAESGPIGVILGRSV
jgi:hypothetical protein